MSKHWYFLSVMGWRSWAYGCTSRCAVICCLLTEAPLFIIWFGYQKIGSYYQA